MAKRKFKAPKCWNCKKELKRVDEIIYELYQFNENTGTYQEKTTSGEQRVKCKECGEDVSYIFEEGVCNYQAK